MAPRSVQTPLAEVAGKVAFVTGGSAGIGLGMARAFSAAGMKVVFTYMRDAHRDQALSLFPKDNPGVHAIRLDTTDRKGMVRAADEAERKFGSVHLLCNNAGVGITSFISNASWQDWDWAMDVNVNGVFNGIRTFLPRMKAHGEGAHILATSSSGGLLAGMLGVYCTTKFAVTGMMESLRAEMAGQNIGVSVFCPGLIRSEIFDVERNRPAHYANPDGSKLAPPAGGPDQAFVDLMALAMDPLEAGQKVLEGIRRNDLYILTHEEFSGPMHDRYEALRLSLPKERAPQARIDGMKTYVPDIYAVEAERKRRER